MEDWPPGAIYFELLGPRKDEEGRGGGGGGVEWEGRRRDPGVFKMSTHIIYGESGHFWNDGLLLLALLCFRFFYLILHCKLPMYSSLV